MEKKIQFRVPDWFPDDFTSKDVKKLIFGMPKFLIACKFTEKAKTILEIDEDLKKAFIKLRALIEAEKNYKEKNKNG